MDFCHKVGGLSQVCHGYSEDKEGKEEKCSCGDDVDVLIAVYMA